MKSAAKKIESTSSKAKLAAVEIKGPSLFEVEYLSQLKTELEAFLKSRNFATIREIQVGYAGADYTGTMRVSA